jgi:peptidoglycan-N-acetylglucosamine deacetylase
MASVINAQLTFFVLGEQALSNSDLIQQMLRLGHEVGNHSWSHVDFSRAKDEEIRRELCDTHKLIQRCGGNPKLMRPPYGKISQRQRRWIESEFGYRIVLWNIDSEDWRCPDTIQISKRILHSAYDGAVVLSHDIHSATVQAMIMVFETLANKGFEFVTVPHLS